MTQSSDAAVAKLKNHVTEDARARQRHVEARDALVQTQYRLRAIELQLEQVRGEVRRLERTGLTSVVLGLLGRRESALAEHRQTCAELEQQFADCQSSLSRLEHETSELERELEQADARSAEYRAALEKKQRALESGDEKAAARLREFSARVETVEVRAARVQKAVRAVEEARRDLQDERSTLATFGRCRVAEGCKEISMIVNVGRASAASDCAGRVVQSLRRARARIANVLADRPDAPDDRLAKTDDELRRYTDVLPSSWVADADEVLAADQRLLAARSLLQERLAECRAEAEELDGERRAFIESAFAQCATNE